MEKSIEEFTKHEWDHMHDYVLHCTWKTTKKKSTREELIELFNKLPDDLKEDAYEFGMSDTLWRDNFIKYYGKKKHFKVNHGKRNKMPSLWQR